MVQLVALTQSTQDLQAELKIRLPDQHLLKASVQRRILFHRAPVFLRRCGADATQIPLRQGRLQQAGGVSAAAIAAHHCVQLIDEQHYAGIGAAHLLQHRAQALFELTAELGTGNQCPEIKGDQAQALQRLGHFASHDPLGQELGDGRLADPRLTDQHRVVLAAARQHLDQVANLAVAADHRIQGARFRLSREVAAIGIEGGGLDLQFARSQGHRGGRRTGLRRLRCWNHRSGRNGSRSSRGHRRRRWRSHGWAQKTLEAIRHQTLCSE